MKTLIIVLIIVSFLQSAILPLNLVLIMLICRAYIRVDKANLFLALAFGLLDSHLNLKPLGFQSIIYLSFVQITASLSKSPLSGNSFLIIPISLALLSLNQLANLILSHQTFLIFPKTILESLLSWPALYLLRLWEERFIVRKEIKLKV